MLQFIYLFVFLHGILHITGVGAKQKISSITTDEVHHDVNPETVIYEAILMQEGMARNHDNKVDNLMTPSVESDESRHHNHHDDFGRMSILNMTCDFFTQPLNHFVPRGRSPTYEERYCTYDGFVLKNNHEDDNPEYADTTMTAPIFFYTGNESPLEQYINQVRIIS